MNSTSSPTTAISFPLALEAAILLISLFLEFEYISKTRDANK